MMNTFIAFTFWVALLGSLIKETEAGQTCNIHKKARNLYKNGIVRAARRPVIILKLILKKLFVGCEWN